MTSAGGHRYWALTHFRAFKAEHEYGERRITRLHLDQGSEFMSSGFKRFCNESAIRMETSTTDNPQQNGMAEVTNRVIFGNTWALLYDAQINNRWWHETLASAIYIHNRSPHSQLQVTPYEAFWGEKPDLAHLWVIGSTAWFRKHGISAKKKLPKFQEKATRGKLIGYEAKSRVYRILVDDSHVIRSSNVHFQELPPRESANEATGAAEAPRPEPSCAAASERGTTAAETTPVRQTLALRPAKRAKNGR